MPRPTHPLSPQDQTRPPRWGWIIALGAAGLLLVVLALALRSLDRPSQLTLEAGEILPLEGQAFQIDLKDRLPAPWQPLSDNRFNLYRSDLLLFEDGQRFGRPHASFDAVTQDGGGGYLHWARRLIFSTPDHSDPRTNGRTYRVEFTAGVSYRILRQLADIGGWMILVAVGAALWMQRRAVTRAITAGVRHLRRRYRDYLLAALIPAGVSLAALFLIPPLWNGSDSTIWLLWQLTWIPHHPPIYPAFMALLNATLDGTPQILRVTQWVQHLAYVLAIAYVASAYRVNWQILLVSALVCLGGALNLFAHGFFTEGLANPLMLVFLGALLRLHRDGLTAGVAAALGLALLAASLTRHALLVLGVLPVAYLVMLALLSRGRAAGLVVIAQAAALMIAVGIANTAVTKYVSLLLDAQEQSILGRAGVYRLQAANELVPPAARQAWIAAIGERARDPAVQQALPLMALTPNPWTGPRDAITATPALFGQHPDTLMNAGFKAFAYSLDPYALSQWGRELAHATLGGTVSSHCPGQVNCLFEGSAYSIESVFPADLRSLGRAGRDRGRATGVRRRLPGAVGPARDAGPGRPPAPGPTDQVAVPGGVPGPGVGHRRTDPRRPDRRTGRDPLARRPGLCPGPDLRYRGLAALSRADRHPRLALQRRLSRERHATDLQPGSGPATDLAPAGLRIRYVWYRGDIGLDDGAGRGDGQGDDRPPRPPRPGCLRCRSPRATGVGASAVVGHRRVGIEQSATVR